MKTYDEVKSKLFNSKLIQTTEHGSLFQTANVMRALNGVEEIISGQNHILLEQKDHINALSAELEKHKELISKILGSFALERTERFDLIKECNSLSGASATNGA